jgi:hypothetical protein
MDAGERALQRCSSRARDCAPAGFAGAPLGRVLSVDRHGARALGLSKLSRAGGLLAGSRSISPARASAHYWRPFEAHGEAPRWREARRFRFDGI